MLVSVHCCWWNIVQCAVLLLEHCSVCIVLHGTLFSVHCCCWNTVQCVSFFMEHCSVCIVVVGTLFSVYRSSWNIVQCVLFLVEHCPVYIVLDGTLFSVHCSSWNIVHGAKITMELFFPCALPEVKHCSLCITYDTHTLQCHLLSCSLHYLVKPSVSIWALLQSALITHKCDTNDLAALERLCLSPNISHFDQQLCCKM